MGAPVNRRATARSTRVCPPALRRAATLPHSPQMTDDPVCNPLPARLVFRQRAIARRGVIFMKIAQMIAVAALALGLQGCAAAGLAVAEAGAGVGLGAGIDHTMNGIAYKTFTASTNEVRFATLDALDRMGMKVTGDAASEA